MTASSGPPSGSAANPATWKSSTALLLGAPAAAYLLYVYGPSLVDWVNQPVLETDFDSFLTARGDHPTGLAPNVVQRQRPTAAQRHQQLLAAVTSALEAVRSVLPAPVANLLKWETEAPHGEVDEDGRDPLVFATFLKAQRKDDNAASGQAGGQATGLAGSDATAAPGGPCADQARIVVMFGTEYGFSKEIAEKLVAKLHEAGKYWPVLHDMADHPEGMDLSAEQVVLMACSTQGDGVPPTEARGFCDWLTSGKAGQLPSLNFSVCALGDKAYQHYCRCGKSLDAALEAAGAQRVAPRQDVNKEDYEAVDAWLTAVLAGLDKLSLKPVGAAGAGVGAGTAAAAPKRWGKARPYQASVVATEGLCRVSGKDDKNTIRVELDLGDSGLTYTPGDALGIYPTNATQYVSELVSVLGGEAKQQVPTPAWHYELAKPGADASAATKPPTLPLTDALAQCYDLKSPRPELFTALWQAYPKAIRAAATVTAATHAGTNGLASTDAPLTTTTGLSTGNGSLNGAAAPSLTDSTSLSGTDTPLSRATSGLSSPGNGVASPKAKGGNSKQGSPKTGSPKARKSKGGFVAPQLTEAELVTQAAALHALVQGGSTAQEGYMATGRHVVDVLREFSGARLTVDQVLGCLRQLQPRLYSISSAPAENPRRVQVTVAEVKYSALGYDRVGVCSTYLSERIKNGARVPVYIHKNPDFRLPPSPGTPIIMVGPGTGLAPFRSFILERVLAHKSAVTAAAKSPRKSPRSKSQNGGLSPDVPASPVAPAKPGEMVLFFGCRRKDQDYLYGKQLESWASAGHITLHTAFSRHTDKKVYVQDRLAEQAGPVWELLHSQGAHFYVCGDASSMAGSVERQLLSIIGEGLRQEGDDDGTVASKAEAYLADLSASGRYQRDVWY